MSRLTLNNPNSNPKSAPDQCNYTANKLNINPLILTNKCWNSTSASKIIYICCDSADVLLGHMISCLFCYTISSSTLQRRNIVWATCIEHIICHSAESLVTIWCDSDTDVHGQGNVLCYMHYILALLADFLPHCLTFLEVKTKPKWWMLCWSNSTKRWISLMLLWEIFFSTKQWKN